MCSPTRKFAFQIPPASGQVLARITGHPTRIIIACESVWDGANVRVRHAINVVWWTVPV